MSAVTPAQKKAGEPPVSRADMTKLKLGEWAPALRSREEWRNSEEGKSVLAGLLEQLKSPKKEARAKAADMIGDLGYWKAVGALADAYGKETEREAKIAILNALELVMSEKADYRPWPPEFYSSPDCLRTREKLIEVIRNENDVELVKKAADALGFYYDFWGDAEKVLTKLYDEAKEKGKDREIARAIFKPISENAVR